jgi:hypothetical protein
MLRRSTIATFVAAVVMAHTEAASQAPSALSVTAKLRPVEFAMLLANAAIPVGLEVDVADRSPSSMPPFDVAKELSAPAPSVVAAFNSNHRDYRATVLDGVIVIRPSANQASYLTEKIGADELVQTGAMRALQRVFSGLTPNPRLRSEGGLVGSRLGVTGTDAGDYSTVTLRSGTTVLDALNDIALQSGQGWVVVTAGAGGSAEIVQAGLLHKRGSKSVINLKTDPN